MITENFINGIRNNKQVSLEAEFVVCGGGLSGVCAAITAARTGVSVVLIQDRPVLGGNASSEVRLWALGATSHMGNNNRWAREGGLIDEILVENTYRNKEGNPVFFDSLLQDFVTRESNITLLLNTAVIQVEKTAADTIGSVCAFCAQNSTEYTVEGKYFCDATGDGIVGFQSGAAFRIGQEARSEFNELMAPEDENMDLLGHSIFFHSKDTGKPVKYIAPEIALQDITKIPKYSSIKIHHNGTDFWWLEYGGKLDTIHETEEIRDELWKVVYGVWDYIKNSGEFPEAETKTLEWVGLIPGKRESRRFEGHYMLKQSDIIDQKQFEDAVAFGGWALDHHDVEGVYTSGPSCVQWHSKGIYQIPYRCYVSKNVSNLFVAGRIISASHVAFGTTRVMTTCAHGAQAVGMAASICLQQDQTPVDLMSGDGLKKLQNNLNALGQSIPNVAYDGDNLLRDAQVTASSSLALSNIPFNGDWKVLDNTKAQLLPLQKDEVYTVEVGVKASKETCIEAQIRLSDKVGNFTPNLIHEQVKVEISEGEQRVKFAFKTPIAESQYAFVSILKNPDILLQESNTLITGTMAVFHTQNEKVSNNGRQVPPSDIGINEFDFFTPIRRPEGKNLAMNIKPEITGFGIGNLYNGFVRPSNQSNAWVADMADEQPSLEIKWNEKICINELTIFFDADYDHAMETVQWGHFDDVMPFVVRDYVIEDENGNVVYKKQGNHQTINHICFDSPLMTDSLKINFSKSECTVSVFEIIVK